MQASPSTVGAAGANESTTQMSSSQTRSSTQSAALQSPARGAFTVQTPQSSASSSKHEAPATHPADVAQLSPRATVPMKTASQTALSAGSSASAHAAFSSAAIQAGAAAALNWISGLSNCLEMTPSK